MNWKTKAVLQKTISTLPFGGGLNYFLQRFISGNLPMSEDVFVQKSEAALLHLQAYTSHHQNIEYDMQAYEFGAGYDLAVPILLAQYGVRKQVVTDINPLKKQVLVTDVLKRLGITANTNDLGIEYKAPVDARKTSFETGRFDLIHSTDTLEHIPQVDILPILQECYRLLKPGGVISCVIDLCDHYSYFDSNISKFNFYQFKKTEWESRYNNRLQYQNRMVANDYYSLFAKAGFAPVQLHLTKAGSEETNRLQTLKLAGEFKNKPIEEINSLRCHIVAEKPD